jgi:hypothetical protein
MKIIIGQIAATSAIFGLVGPAVGALFANLYLAWPLTGSLSENLSGGMLLIYLMSLLFGYAIGLIPAVISGAIYGFVAGRYFHGRKLTYVLVIVVSGIIGYCATYLPLFIYLGPSIGSARSAAELSILGAVSSVVCAVFVHVTGALPNNSFKPTPHRGVGHVPALR